MTSPTSPAASDHPREDLFTPIHKALRTMIYTLGRELATNDFADAAATEALVAKLRHDLTVATQATCVLCVLHEHAGHEEKSIFPRLNAKEPALVAEMLDAHSTIVRKLTQMAKTSDELLEQTMPSARVALGCQLVRESNDFFAFYLAHMNREELEVVPATHKHFTDPELLRMRAEIMSGFTPDQMASMMRWMLPSLNVHELTGFYGGLKAGAPPPLFQMMVRAGAANVEPARWNTVCQRVGI